MFHCLCFFCMFQTVLQVVNRQIPSIWDGEVTVRIYYPAVGNGNTEQLVPALVYAHGGGWALGSLDSHDGLCRSACSLVFFTHACVGVCASERAKERRGRD